MKNPICLLIGHKWSQWYSKKFPGKGYRYCLRPLCDKTQRKELG